MDRLDRLQLSLEGNLDMPQGGVVVLPPMPRPIMRVEVNGKGINEFTAEGFTCRESPAQAVVSY